MRKNTEKRIESWLTWFDYGRAIEKLCIRLLRAHSSKPFVAVAGVERGGLPIAVAVSHALGIPLIAAKDLSCFSAGDRYRILIVDDICDSGETLKPFEEATLAALFCREDTTEKVHFCGEVSDKWIVFPYEKTELNKDYLADFSNTVGKEG